MVTTVRKEQALEQGLVQTIFRPCAEFLVELTQLRPGERLLDIGCGSGIVARVALEQQPELSAAHGFDYESAAIRVAEGVGSQHEGREKLKFWTGDVSNPEAYRGPWNVCIAQHVVQHVPTMLSPMREALAEGGRAIICTWPVCSDECPAYDFLYSAAREGQKIIGMSMEALCQNLRDAGIVRFTTLTPELYTPPVEPMDFLRQYLEGKQEPPADIEEYLSKLSKAGVKELAGRLGGRAYANGMIQFRIAINAIVASV